MFFHRVALAVLTISSAATAAYADVAKLTVKEVAGEVTVISGGHTQKATVGFTFIAPAEVHTGRDSSVLLADSVTTLKVSQNTLINIPASAQPTGMLDKVLQRSGSVLYNVNSRNGRPFAVETALLTSVVKGTLFSINVQEQSATVALLEGSLDVSGAGLTEHVLLTPGDAARRGAGERNISVERHSTAATERAPARAVRNPSLPNELVESRAIDRASDDLARVTAAIGLAPPSATIPTAPPPAGTPPVVTTPPASTPPASTPPGTAPPDTAPPATTQPPGVTPPATTPPGTPPPGTSPPVTTPPVTTPPVSTPPATPPPATPPPATTPPASTPPVTTPPSATPPTTTPPSDESDGSSGKGSRKGRGRGHEDGRGEGNDDRDRS